jgi:hypothetical protein
MRRNRLTSKLALTVAGLMCLMGAFAFGAGTSVVGRAEGAPPSSLLPAYAASGLGDLGRDITGLSSENAATPAAPQASAPAPAGSVSAAAGVKPAPAPAAPEESAGPESAAKPPPPESLTPPYNLQGTFVPNVGGPYVQLTWTSDNPKSILKSYNIYRVALPDGEAPTAPYAVDKNPPYSDTSLTLGTTYRYWVTAVGKDGSESGASATVDVETYNVTPPSTPTGLTAYAIDPGVTLDWNPNPELDITGYNLYTSGTPTGNKTKVVSMIAATDCYYASGGSTLYYWVSAVNYRNLESAPAMIYPTATVPEIIQEDDPRVTTSGTWSTEHYVGPNDGKILVAEAAGARLTLSFTGSQVKMAVAKYWSCGSARIYVDGTPVTTINEFSEAPTYNVIELNIPGLVHGNHTLTVEVMGSGNPSYPYNFVNVDSFEVR